ALVHGDQAVVVTDLSAESLRSGLGDDADTALGRLDVTVLHRVLVEQVWGLPDTVNTVGYAHDIADAIADAESSGGTAVLLRATCRFECIGIGVPQPRTSRLRTLGVQSATLEDAERGVDLAQVAPSPGHHNEQLCPSRRIELAHYRILEGLQSTFRTTQRTF